jgi:hypothetical protein
MRSACRGRWIRGPRRWGWDWGTRGAGSIWRVDGGRCRLAGTYLIPS